MTVKIENPDWLNTTVPDYLDLLDDEDRKRFEDGNKTYFSYEPLMLALVRRLERVTNDKQ